MADSVIELSICLSDIDKALIQPSKAHPEKKFIYNVVVSERQQPDQYGSTHTVYINYKASDGKWYKNYIGSGRVKTFGAQAPLPPPPAAPQAPVAPQAPAPQRPVAPAPQRPAAPAPTPREYQSAPSVTTTVDVDNDLPFIQ